MPADPDVFADLKRLAARARRAALKRYPKGSSIRWNCSFPRVVKTGTVRDARHNERTGAVELGVDEPRNGPLRGPYDLPAFHRVPLHRIIDEPEGE